MTVTATNRKNQFSTNGVTTEFTFDFAITDVSQVYALTVDDDGTETVFENFTAVKSEVIEGGTLTTNEVLNGVDLLIYRDTALTQQVDYESGGKFPADSHEQALDKLTLQNQDQQEELGRTLKSSISNDDPYTVGKLESGFMLASVGSEIVSTSITEGDLEIAKGNEITMIARSLNVLNTQVIYSTDTTTVLDDVLYIYDASEQITYAKPSDIGTGEVIVSVDDGVLTTDSSTYDMEFVNRASIYANPKDFGYSANGIDDASPYVDLAQATGKPVIFEGGVFKFSTHYIIRNKIVVMPSATLIADWTETSWITIYSSGDPIRPEWFGAVGTRAHQPIPDTSVLEATAAGIQAALDTAIDISIDPIGIVSPTNHGHYNTIDLQFDGGVNYYVGGATILIRSEHHFLGVTLRCPSMYSFSNALRGDGTNDPLLKVEKPLNNSDNGAATTNRITQMGFGACKTAIYVERADQSNYIDHCRFTSITGNCIQLFQNVSTIVTDNQFASAGGGYFLYAEFQNNIVFSNNIVDESVFYSRGVYVSAGSNQGGINISNNTMRNTPIIVTSASVDAIAKVSISHNQLSQMDDTYSSVAISCSNFLRKPQLIGNIVNFNNKINSADFIGIQAFNADIIGGAVVGDFDVGVDLAMGFCSARVEGAKVGYAHTRSFTGTDRRIHMQPNIHDCGTGILIERSYSKVLGGTIYGCDLGIDASNGAARGGLISDVTLESNAVDITRYEPANRQAEYMVIRDCIYPEYGYLPRSGIEKKAVLIPLNQNSAPTTANWIDGDSIVTNTQIFHLVGGVWV